ncbi:carboxylesterase [Devosia geojensis]|uniref:Carboxylesterase n=1 Tax=Devosia geojensis TaxID=443610 RepID=A0A0F5FTN1_9HYPH|nr:carboxylesterase family protein [Devosia geojensis]KKB12178.1 carboxylesterase [Devosia geojensis]
MTCVMVPGGEIEGFSEHGNLCFLSVPYAAPVTRERRFLAPQPVEPWRGVRDATRLGPVCPQVPTYGPVGRGATSSLTQGTDFLTLNIRTPSLDGRAPVLVWVHGGGYAVGSANEPVLQSGAFAASGIVEVTVNYRLGALGFLHIDGMPDNRGLLDLLAALRWVKDNIERFGGDPDRVTFAGRSAGGFAIAAVMAMPGAKGLFSRAMPQSGASTAIAGMDDARKLTRRMCTALGTDEAGIMDAPIDALLVAQRDLCNESYEQHDYDRDGSAAMLGVPFVPVIDGVSLLEHPEAAAAAGRTMPVPMMIGCTSAEYLTHSTILPDDLDFAGAARFLHERVRPLGWTGQGIVDTYRKALSDHSPHGIWRAVAGDLVFQNPTTRFALLHGRHQPVWKYLYGPVLPDETGAAHGAEVGAVWYRRGMDPTEQPERQRVTDIAFAEKVHEVWRAFIAGDPLPHAWPRFTEKMKVVLHMAEGAIEPAPDRFAERLGLWQRP